MFWNRMGTMVLVVAGAWSFSSGIFIREPAALAGEDRPAANRDKWELWRGPTCLRGANLWQKRVKPDDAMGPGPVGPPYSQQDLDRLAAWGADYVNISHPGVFGEKPEYRIDNGVFQSLVRLIDRARRGSVRGRGIPHGSGPQRGRFWRRGREEARRALDFVLGPTRLDQDVRTTAQQLKDQSAVVGYDLMVEPDTRTTVSGTGWPARSRRPFGRSIPRRLFSWAAPTGALPTPWTPCTRPAIHARSTWYTSMSPTPIRTKSGRAPPSSWANWKRRTARSAISSRGMSVPAGGQ